MVKPKKHLGQHFLLDQDIAEKIATSLEEENDLVIEVGPGTGVLTQFLEKKYSKKLKLVEIDRESIAYLNQHFSSLAEQIISEDFLKMDLSQFNVSRISIIGNYTYNISSQILFKALEYREQVVELSGMFQKEVAARITAKPGNKTYGILSVLSQAYFKTEYLFDVPPEVFDPPPKVVSGVIRLKRFRTSIPDCDEKFFKSVVKLAFNQRRKTLRNALKSILPEGYSSDVLQLRAETVSYTHLTLPTKA